MRHWCMLQASLRVLGTQLNVDNTLPRQLELRAMVDAKTRLTHSSTMVWLRSPGNDVIVLIPDYTDLPLSSIEYSKVIAGAFRLTEATTGLPLMMSCKQAFWVFYALVAVEYYFEHVDARRHAMKTLSRQPPILCLIWSVDS